MLRISNDRLFEDRGLPIRKTLGRNLTQRISRFFETAFETGLFHRETLVAKEKMTKSSIPFDQLIFNVENAGTQMTWEMFANIFGLLTTLWFLSAVVFLLEKVFVSFCYRLNARTAR